MKVALNVSEESGDSDANIFTDENINRIERVLEQEIHELLPNLCEFDSCEISVMITTPENIRELNRTYRNVDEATDVLSFPMFEKAEIESKIKNKDFENVDILGDMIISIPQVEIQAKEYGHSFERELAYMVVHSFYHLIGYDHIEEKDKLEMRPKEEFVLNRLNIKR